MTGALGEVARVRRKSMRAAPSTTMDDNAENAGPTSDARGTYKPPLKTAQSAEATVALSQCVDTTTIAPIAAVHTEEPLERTACPGTAATAAGSSSPDVKGKRRASSSHKIQRRVLAELGWAEIQERSAPALNTSTSTTSSHPLVVHHQQASMSAAGTASAAGLGAATRHPTAPTSHRTPTQERKRRNLLGATPTDAARSSVTAISEIILPHEVRQSSAPRRSKRIASRVPVAASDLAASQTTTLQTPRPQVAQRQPRKMHSIR